MIARRKILAALSALPLLSIVRPASAARRVRVMMILWRGETAAEAGFRAALESRGFAPEYLVRDAGQNLDAVALFAQEARELRPDLVYCWGTPVSLALVGSAGEVDPDRHLTDIPVVFSMVASPIEAGLTGADGRSGRNVTGASHIAPISHQIKAIAAYHPFSRLAVIFNPAERNSILTVQLLEAQAESAGFTLIKRPLPLDESGRPRLEALDGLIGGLVGERPDYLYLGPDSFVGANAVRMTEAALAAGLPTFSATEVPLRGASALFGLVTRYDMVGRLAGLKAADILDGRFAGDLPVETPSRFFFLINISVAKRLDFYPPLAVLDYAEVFR